MRINESALKQYVVGFRGAKPAVLWFDIKNFKEIKGETSTTISFEEDGITYTYTGSDTTGYTETKNKSPFITDYLLVDEDDLIKRGYLQLFDNVLADEDDEDPVVAEFEYDEDDYGSNCGNSYGCGRSYGGCGGGYRRYGCGGYGGCGGGGGC